MNSSLRVVTFGELLMRLSTPHHHRFEQVNGFDMVFGGAEANVAVALAKMGWDSTFVSLLPNNAISNRAVAELQLHGVNTSKISFGGDRMGLYFFETGVGDRPGQVIYDRSGSSMATIDKGHINWEMALEGNNWFHFSGITPAISESAATACLAAIKTASKMGLKISCDVNYRSKLWKYTENKSAIMSELVQYCDWLITNEKDASLFFDIQPIGANSSIERFESVARQLVKKFPKLNIVAGTLRSSDHSTTASIQGVMYHQDQLVTSKVFDIHTVVDRIGTGDAFMAGLIHGMKAYNEPKVGLDFATASAVLKHTIFGDYNLATAKEIEDLIKGAYPGKVDR